MRCRICRMICSTSTESDLTVTSAIRTFQDAQCSFLSSQFQVPSSKFSSFDLAPSPAAELRRFLHAHGQNPERAPRGAQPGACDFGAFFRNRRVPLDRKSVV